MAEKGTGLGHCKGLVVWENTSTFCLNEDVILHSYSCGSPFSGNQQNLVRKLLYVQRFFIFLGKPGAFLPERVRELLARRSASQ